MKFSNLAYNTEIPDDNAATLMEIPVLAKMILIRSLDQTESKLFMGYGPRMHRFRGI